MTVGSAFADLGSNLQKIVVPAGTYTVADGNGNQRQITPSCSGAPICTTDPATGATSCHPGNTEYSFWYKPGMRDKLAIVLAGGGMCWDSDSCVTSRVVGQSTYLAEPYFKTLPPGTTAFGAALFDQTNPANPYKDWSVVVVDYCTGDMHAGSNDAVYTDYTGLATGTPGGPVTIHHRGYDNLLYVRDWISRLYATGNSAMGRSPVSQLLVAGYSAGGFGVYLQYPTFRSLFPQAKGYAMSDAGAIISTDYFRDQTLANWNVQNNLASWIPGVVGAYTGPVDTQIQSTVAALAAYYPQDRFANYNTEWDAVLALSYVAFSNPGNPAVWSQLTPQLYTQYVIKKDTALHTMDYIPNVRNYQAEGCRHSALINDDVYYKPATNQDISFLDWFKALTAPGITPDWHNSYTTNPVPPTLLEFYECVGTLNLNG